MPDEHASAGQLAAAISNAVVRSIAETTGRGPTRARDLQHLRRSSPPSNAELCS